MTTAERLAKVEQELAETKKMLEELASQRGRRTIQAERFALVDRALRGNHWFLTAKLVRVLDACFQATWRTALRLGCVPGDIVRAERNAEFSVQDISFHPARKITDATAACLLYVFKYCHQCLHVFSIAISAEFGKKKLAGPGSARGWGMSLEARRWRRATAIAERSVASIR